MLSTPSRVADIPIPLHSRRDQLALGVTRCPAAHEIDLACHSSPAFGRWKSIACLRRFCSPTSWARRSARSRLGIADGANCSSSTTGWCAASSDDFVDAKSIAPATASLRPSTARRAAALRRHGCRVIRLSAVSTPLSDFTQELPRKLVPERAKEWRARPAARRRGTAGAETRHHWVDLCAGGRSGGRGAGGGGPENGGSVN